MSESTQHKLDRIRSPRVQITYDVEIGNAIEMKELPFVVGVMADLSGMITDPLPIIKDRKFVEIDNDSFNEVMLSICPRLAFSVANKLGGGADHLGVELFFKNIDDFNPLNVVKQVAPLASLYESRTLLKDLLTKLDGNDPLDVLLHDVLTNADKCKAVSDQANSDAGGDDLNKILIDGKLVRDDAQRPFALDMVKEFISQIGQAGDNISKFVAAFIQARIQLIDESLNNQLNEIIHNPEFLKLEGSWRSLAYLVMNTNCSAKLKLRLLNITKAELLKDLEKAVEFDQSQLFKKIYEEEYGTFGGHPYSCLVGDYEFTRHPQDIELLEKIASVAAAAHAPFITAAHPKLFDLDSFEHLGIPRDLSKVFESIELVKWNSFRNSEDSRYICLTLPKVLMRLPYGESTVPVEGMSFEETVSGTDSSRFCWGNPAFVLAQRITNAFSLYGWTAAIRGVEGGGIVEDLPAYTFKTTDGDVALKCPTETAITDRREKELSDLGFVSICHCKGTDYAAFFGGQTAQKPKVYNLDDANANSNLSARLPYMLAASRFAHYIKVIMRDKIGSFLTKDNVALYLNTWIANYVLLNDDASQSVKAQYPLREARIDVFDVPGKPGSYRSVVYLRPHFQMEELTASIRLVATLPPPAK